MLTINSKGHFEFNGKVLTTINQVLKASTTYYSDKDATHLILSVDCLDGAIFGKGRIDNFETLPLKVTIETLKGLFPDHNSLLWSEAGIKELTKMAIKRRKTWIRKNSTNN